jgi:hypothetical protein
MGWVAGVAGVADSIHINSTVICLFLIFLFSYFHMFICAFFPVLSYHIGIFHIGIFYIGIFHICIFHICMFHICIFSKIATLMNSMHSGRKMFHRTEGISSELEIFQLDHCW